MTPIIKGCPMQVGFIADVRVAGRDHMRREVGGTPLLKLTHGVVWAFTVLGAMQQ